MKNNLDWLYLNPAFIIQDKIFGFWHEQCILAFIKMWYFPNFVAGSSDNIVDLFKPQTYSICK